MLQSGGQAVGGPADTDLLLLRLVGDVVARDEEGRSWVATM